jgi:hypothetical protein
MYGEMRLTVMCHWLVYKTQHRESGVVTPTQLFNCGNHFDDVGVNGRYNRQ